MPKNDYWKLSAFESAKLIRNGSISSEDLVSSCIERVNKTNAKINAIVDDLIASGETVNCVSKLFECNRKKLLDF